MAGQALSLALFPQEGLLAETAATAFALDLQRVEKFISALGKIARKQES